MREQRRRRCGTVAATICLLALAECVASASQGAGPPPTSRRDVNAALRSNISREVALRSVDKVRREYESKDPREVEAIVTQIKQDFAQIQVMRNDLVRVLKSGETLDYARIGAQAGNIHRRASRLRYYLVQTDGSETAKAPRRLAVLDGDDTARALVVLCNTIHSFVENPAMDLKGTVDAQESIKATQDLARIIDLSDAIRRSADKLNPQK